MSRSFRIAMLGAGVLLALAPHTAGAQSLDYGSGVSGDDTGAAGAASGPGRGGGDDGRKGRHGRTRISPYIEAMQVVSADLSPRSDVVTWSSLAAGVDGNIRGRASEGAFSLRYERRFGYGKSESGDVLSGLVRGAVAVVPHAVTLEGGAIATRASTDADGAALPGAIGRRNTTHLWSVYAGPSVQTTAGDVALTGSYRIGYTEVGTSEQTRTNGTAASGELFDHSTVHNAELRAGVKPGEVLPVGVGAGAGYYREDISNLDQRVEDFHARADVTVPLSPDLAVVGGVGWEKVKISSRDAVRDGTGAPVIGANGRYQTDGNAPRQIAYESTGLIWDAGVTWRPSQHTALEAHAGWRYGGTTYYGSFGWKPSRRQTVNISVYDSISGYGGQVNRTLAALPTDFAVQRNPVTGELGGCVTGSKKGGGCIGGVFGSLRSATFRGRGVQASFAQAIGTRYEAGIAAGYDRRKFIAAPGTILASANGVVDESTWLAAWFSGSINRATSFGTSAYANWYRSNQAAGADALALGVSGSLSHTFDNHLSATAALSLQGIDREVVDDQWNASALVGLRYSFF